MKQTLIYLILFITLLVTGYFTYVHLYQPDINRVETAKIESPPLEGELRTEISNKLAANINSYAEKESIELFRTELVAENPDNVSVSKVFCAHHLYGADDKYAYIMLYCSGFKDIAEGKLERTSNLQIPVKVEYDESRGIVLGYQAPEIGDNYNESIRELLPKEIVDQINLPPYVTDRLVREVDEKVLRL